MKPGVKSSEFWFALVGPVASIAALIASLFGYTLDVSQLVTLGTFVAGHSLVSHGYSKSRATVKASALDNFTYLPSPPAPPTDSPNLALAVAQLTDAA